MLYDLHAAIYKGEQFWCHGDLFLVTESLELAKKYRFKQRHESCPDVFFKRVHMWQLQKMFYVTPTVEYEGHRFKVEDYSCQRDSYLLYTSDLSMIDRLGFMFYDQGMCEKEVPVSETMNPNDEYELIYKRWF